MSKIDKLASKINSLQAQLRSAEAEYQEIRLAELQRVTVKRNAESTTLLFNGRTINARKNRYGYLIVTERGRKLVDEYWGSIHDLRFDIALGAV